MEAKTKKKNFILIVFLLFFIFFVAIYISGLSGYYEYSEYKKTNLTKEKIEEFESDIKNGIDIENKSYLLNEQKDYSNKFSKAGLKTSKYIEKLMTKGIKNAFSIISKLVLDS